MAVFTLSVFLLQLGESPTCLTFRWRRLTPSSTARTWLLRPEREQEKPSPSPSLWWRNSSGNQPTSPGAALRRYRPGRPRPPPPACPGVFRWDGICPVPRRSWSWLRPESWPSRWPKTSKTSSRSWPSSASTAAPPTCLRVSPTPLTP